MTHRPFPRSVPAILVLGIAAVIALDPCGSKSVLAEQPYVEFLHGMQDRGYGELSIDYLNSIKNRSDLPDELKTDFELELAKSYRIAADETQNTDVAAKYLATAQTHLDRLTKEAPNHPEAATAFVIYGDIAVARGQTLLRSASATRDSEKKQALLADARRAFEEARPRFAKAADLYHARFKKLAVPEEPANTTKKSKTSPKRKPAPRVNRKEQQQQDEAEDQWLDARFKLATVDYNLGQTYTDQSQELSRVEALKKAAAGFDAIYQQYRTRRVGLYAHTLHGKALEELGDLDTALDVYDEVLVNQPETPTKSDAPLMVIFSEVERYRLMILAKQAQHAELISEAEEWLKKNNVNRQTAGYQGVAIELAKAQLAAAKSLEGNKRQKLMEDALVTLAGIMKVPGPHQKEAILLQRLSGGEAAPAELKNFDEAVAIADAAAANSVWDEALKGYERALQMSASAKEPARVQSAQYHLAHAQFMSGKIAEAADTAETLAREKPESAVAPAAAALAVSAALNLCMTADNPQRAEKRLVDIADYLLKKWPKRAEADDARIALGKLYLVRGKYDEAISAFEAVNPASDRYAAALYQAAQTRWRMYLEAKKEGAADAKELAQEHRKVIELLTASCQAAKGANSGGLHKALVDPQLLLTEVHLEAGEPQEALALIDPLLASAKPDAAKTIDATTLRIYSTAVKTYVALDDVDRAGQLATLLLTSGGDTTGINGTLIEFADLLQSECKRLEAELTASKGTDKGTDRAGLEKMRADLNADKKLLSSLLEKLGTRREHTLAGMVFIADTSAALGTTAVARRQYQEILTRAEKEPEFAKGNTKAITRVRAQLIGLLRNEKKYREALAEVNRLVEATPNALEPLMEKGRILQGLAETDPKQYNACIAHWTNLRTSMLRMPKKPPEYFEVIYNAAYCLLAASAQSRNPEQAKQAEQLLKSTLALSPHLSGGDMVVKYNALLNRAAKTIASQPKK